MKYSSKKNPEVTRLASGHAICTAVETLEQRLLLSRYGETFLIASTPEVYQPSASVYAAADYAPDGSTVVAYRVGGWDAGVYVQRYDSSGDAIGSPIEVTDTGGGSPAIGTSADGTFAVAYSYYGWLHVARYAPDGSPLNTFAASSSDGGTGWRYTTADVSPDGTITVAWQEYSASGYYTLWAQRFRADGASLGPALSLASAPGTELWYRVASIDQSNTLIVWDAGWDEIHAVVLNHAGVAGPVIDLGAMGLLHDVAVDHSGGFTIAWEANDSSGVHVQRYDSFGAPIGSELRFGETQISSATIRFSSDGGMAVGWTDIVNDRWVTNVARVDNAGRPIGTAFQLVATGGRAMEPRFAVDSDDELFVVYTGWDGADRYWLDRTRFGAGTSLRAIPGQAYTVSEGEQIVLAGNADFLPGQTITQWEWDFDYDGSTFQVDATGPDPVFSAAHIQAPRTYLSLERRRYLRLLARSPGPYLCF